MQRVRGLKEEAGKAVDLKISPKIRFYSHTVSKYHGHLQQAHISMIVPSQI
jgi:ribosome-binding factor A